MSEFKICSCASIISVVRVSCEIHKNCNVSNLYQHKIIQITTTLTTYCSMMCHLDEHSNRVTNNHTYTHNYSLLSRLDLDRKCKSNLILFKISVYAIFIAIGSTEIYDVLVSQISIFRNVHNLLIYTQIGIN